MAKYAWNDQNLDDLLETINIGDPIGFQFNGHDYYIEGEHFDNDALGRVGSYMIQKPEILEDGSFG